MNRPIKTGYPTFLLRSNYANRTLILNGSIWLCVVLLSGLFVWRVPTDSVAYYFRVATLVSSGIPAFLTPHLLLPDTDRPLIQTLNPPPHLLLSTRLFRIVPLLIILSIPAILGACVFVVHGAALTDVAYLLAGSLLITCGIGVWAFAGYMSIGKVSQEWQEKKRGDWYRYFKENIQYGYAVPEGLVPSMMLTGRLLVAGLASVFGWILITYYAGWIAGSIPVLVPGCIGLLSLRRMQARFDRHFFQTNGYYGEVFQTSAGTRANSRVPITHESLYWVPARWRSLTWILLVQMDRRMPLGRWFIIGTIFLTAMAQTGVAAGTFLGCLLGLILIKNGAISSVLNTDCFPTGTLHGGMRFAEKAAAFTFVNLRWTLPLAGVLFLISSITEVISLKEAVVWIYVDVITAAALAGVLLTALAKKKLKSYA